MPMAHSGEIAKWVPAGCWLYMHHSPLECLIWNKTPAIPKTGTIYTRAYLQDEVPSGLFKLPSPADDVGSEPVGDVGTEPGGVVGAEWISIFLESPYEMIPFCLAFSAVSEAFNLDKFLTALAFFFSSFAISLPKFLSLSFFSSRAPFCLSAFS